MKTITNNAGCTLNLGMSSKSDFNALFITIGAWDEFINTITHKYVEVSFLEGRKIWLAIYGSKTLNVPKKCTTPREIAEWINGKDF